MVSEWFAAEAGTVPMALAAGSRIAGYRLEEQIGAGGMAVVFRARDERLHRQVALKILAPALAADEAFRHRFIRESRAAAAVDDPHIIPVFEAGEADGVLFIAMRYVPGGDVRTLIRQLGPLSPERAAAIISSVASALDAAHGAGLVHRDVKPANMLVDARPGRPDHVYLSDFGLSKGAMSSGPTGTGQFLGTASYSAPEQMAGKQVDGRADQYSLACAAFELLSGAPPFPHDQVTAVIWAHMSEPPPPLTARRPDLPPAVDGVLARALAKAAGDRYASCREFADALHGTFGLAPDSPGAGVTQQPDHPRTENVWLAKPPAERETAAPPDAEQHQAGPPVHPGAGGMATAGGNLQRRTDRSPGLTRRRLLLAGAAGICAVGLGGIGWEVERPRAARSAGGPRSSPTRTVAPARHTPIWQANVPFGAGAVMAVAGGVVSLAGGTGRNGNMLHALSASNGTSKWSFTTRISYIPSLAATARDVYVGLNPLYALSASRGATLWTAPVAATFGPTAAGGGCLRR